MTKELRGVFAAVAVFLLLIGLAFVMHLSPKYSEFALSAIVAVTGLTLGWLLGFLASPYTTAEEKRFARYAATISAFFSGYLLSKIEPWLTAVVEAGKGGNRVIAARVLIFVGCATVGAISMYVYRLYVGRAAS